VRTNFVDYLLQYFEETVAETGACTENIRLAERDIQFCFAGERSKDLMRAFVRGNASPAAPELRVMVWDGQTPPRNHVLRAYLFTLTNWWHEYVGPRGHLLDVHGPEFDAVYVPGPDLLYVVDSRRNLAFCWKREPTPLPYWEVCSPFRPLLHCWMRSRGLQFVHAAAVGTPAGGVLMAGKGGSGKSSTALACLQTALRYLCDDYCVIGRSGEKDPGEDYVAHALYSTAKLVGQPDLERFPALARHVWNPDREEDQKAAFFLQEHYPESFLDHFPLRAMLLPVVTGERDTGFAPCSASKALAALAPSTLSQLPASGADDLRFLGQLAKHVPAYELRLGTDIGQIPGVLRELISLQAAE